MLCGFSLVAGTNFGTRGISGEPGHLEIRFFKFSSRHWRFLSFNNDYHWGSVEHKFHIEAATVELDSGMIEIDAGTDSGTEVAENLALSFSVALLHVSFWITLPSTDYCVYIWCGRLSGLCGRLSVFWNLC